MIFISYGFSLLAIFMGFVSLALWKRYGGILGPGPAVLTIALGGVAFILTVLAQARSKP